MPAPVTIEKIPFRYYEEIKSILAQHGRRDLVKALKYYRDDEYKPPDHSFMEDSSDSESGEEERYESDDVVVDSDGLLSLKEQ